MRSRPRAGCPTASKPRRPSSRSASSRTSRGSWQYRGTPGRAGHPSRGPGSRRRNTPGTSGTCPRTGRRSPPAGNRYPLCSASSPARKHIYAQTSRFRPPHPAAGPPGYCTTPRGVRRAPGRRPHRTATARHTRSESVSYRSSLNCNASNGYLEMHMEA